MNKQELETAIAQGKILREKRIAEEAKQVEEKQKVEDEKTEKYRLEIEQRAENAIGRLPTQITFAVAHDLDKVNLYNYTSVDNYPHSKNTFDRVKIKLVELGFDPIVWTERGSDFLNHETGTTYQYTIYYLGIKTPELEDK